MPNKTCLFDRHVGLGGRIVDFHGWLLPVQYEGILAEHGHCRRGACLFDTSHMGQFAVTGAAAAEELDSVLTQSAGELAVGKARYGFLLNERAGIIDDTILMRLGCEEFLLVVNAGPLEGDFRWLSGRLGGKARIDNRSGSWGKVDLQGPESFKVLSGRVDFDLASLDYFCVRRGACCGQRCIVSRTGYTGELGYEIFAPAEGIPVVFDKLLADPIVAPAGLGARDLLRLEMCYPLYGQDISEQTNPLEADLGRFAGLGKGREFIGSEALAKIADDGPARKLVAFRTDSRRRANTGETIFSGDVEVGEVTSAGLAPGLGVSVGLGYVTTACAASGTELAVRTQRGDLPVVVADKPLYENGTCRIAAFS